MKKIYIIFCLLGIAGFMNAQTTDTVTANINEDVLEEDPSRDRIIMDIHWDGWLNSPDSLKIKGLSSGIGLHLFYDIPLGGKSSNVSFAIGGGISWSNYYNNSYFTYDTSQYTVSVPFSDTLGINKNKLTLTYFEVPIEFRFRTDPKQGNSFKVAIGFKGGYVLSNHVKYVGEDWLEKSNDEIKYKNYRVKNMSNLQYGPTLRIGYSKINIDAYFGLSDLFEEGKGPTGNPLTIAISFNPF